MFNLLHLSDVTLPIGGFSHSAGLETYVQQGKVRDAATAKAFVVAMLQQNLLHTDGAFVSLAYDAALQNNFASIIQLDEECTAVKLPKEMREASKKLGMRLIKIFEQLCSNNITTQYHAAIINQAATGHYAIAFGLYAQALGIVKEAALLGFYYNAAVGMVTNCVKLIPLGQQDGQRLLFSLQSVVEDVVQKSITPEVDLIGLCCNAFDISCMQHEQLYSRLYMS